MGIAYTAMRSDSSMLEILRVMLRRLENSPDFVPGDLQAQELRLRLLLTIAELQDAQREYQIGKAA